MSESNLCSEDVKEWRNMELTSVDLCIGEYGPMALYIRMEAGCDGVTYSWDNLGMKMDTLPTMGSMIYYLMQVAGVDEWSQIKGRYVRAGFNSAETCCCLKHIVDDSKVFCIRELVDYAKNIEKRSPEEERE